MHKCYVVIAALWFSINQAVAANEELQENSTANRDSIVVIDTTIYSPGGSLNKFTPVTDTTNYERKLSANPTLALFKSMLIPGWGQLANGSPKRAIIYAGLDAWFIGAALHYRSQARNYRRLFEATSDLDLRNQYYDLYNDRRDERNKYTWFTVIVTFVAMFDAYVDAHLSGFPSQEKHPVDLSVGMREEGEIVTVLSLNF